MGFLVYCSRFIKTQSTPWLMAQALALLAVIGALDYFTG